MWFHRFYWREYIHVDIEPDNEMNYAIYGFSERFFLFLNLFIQFFFRYPILKPRSCILARRDDNFGRM